MYYSKIIIKPLALILIMPCLVFQCIAQIHAEAEPQIEALAQESNQESEVIPNKPEVEKVTEVKTLDFDAVKGVWLTQFNKGAAYFIIKRNNIAHYFYKETSDNTVYKGQWSSSSPDSLTFNWENGASLIFDLNSKKTSFTPFGEGEEAPVLSDVEKIAEAQLGAWASPQSSKEVKNKYLPSDYFGLWKLSDTENLSFLFIHKDREVSLYKSETPISKETPMSPSLIGKWFKHGQQLHIAWENGTYSVVDNSDPSAVKLFQHKPGESILGETKKPTLLSRDQSDIFPSGWDPRNNSKRPKSISFSSFNFKKLLKFYRGQWIAMSDTNFVEQIRLGRFGGVTFQSNKQQKGNWYISGSGILINLENGERMLLRHIGTGFLLFVYEATRPLDGYPNRIVRTAPLDTSKLDNLNTVPIFTLKLIKAANSIKYTNSLATNKATEESIPAFGGKNLPNNPWWWPIWSDREIGSKNSLGDFSTDNTSDVLTTGQDSIVSKEALNKKQNPKKTAKQPKGSNWSWPF